MYEPDKRLCETFVNSTPNAVLNEEKGVVTFKGVVHFRLVPHYNKDKYVALVSVETNVDKRGNGIGSEMLSAVASFLDWKKLTCVVYPESHGKNKNDRKLRAWYKRHGFKPMKGQTTMIRK